MPNVVSTPTHVTVYEPLAPGKIATTSADNLGTHWWLCRVLVPEGFRRQGHGPRILRLLLAEAWKQDPLPVHVCPGGYGSDPVKLRAWYIQQGATPLQEKPPCLQWLP